MAAESRISALVEWATSRGARLHDAVEVYNDAQTGFSFRVKPSATQPLPAWATIVSLPASLSLSYLDAIIPQSDGQDKSPYFPAEFITRTPAHVVGRLFLVRQFLLERESPWWAYIQALPQPADRDAWALPPFWPDDEAELLEGTNVEVGLEKIRRDVRREYDEAVALLGLLGHDSAFLRALTPALYHWAYCIFSSRSFRPSLVLDLGASSEQEGRGSSKKAVLPDGVKVDDFSVLLPLFDIGNHDMTMPVRWELNRCLTNGNTTENGVVGESRCELSVGREFAPAAQVFNNYSMKTNAELLLGYGFMIPPTEDLHNDYTHVRKRTDAPAASDEYFISRRPMAHPSSLLGRTRQQSNGSDASGQTNGPIQGNQTLGAFQHVQEDMVWDIFCTLTQTPERRAALIPLDDANGESNGAGGPAEERRRQEKFFSGQVGDECRVLLHQTAAVIQHKVFQELERLDETEVEVAEGDEADLSANQRLAIEYRRRCRAVLENTLEAMEADMGADDDMNDGVQG
jgi:hypothetical protein